jgi:hypothetical protein
MIRVASQLNSIAEAITAGAGREVEPPSVNVTVSPPDAPVVKVSVPDQQPPVVNVTVPPAEPPIVNVTVPAAPAPAGPTTTAAPVPREPAPQAHPSPEPSLPITPVAAGGTPDDVPDPSLFGRRFFTAYLAEDDLDFYWEVGDDGWAVRQLEIQRSTGQALAAATLDEWRRAGETGPIGQGRQGGEFSERALDPAAPDVQTRPISGTDFELRWTTARRQLGLG